MPAHTQLLPNTRYIRSINATAAGITDINGTGVDTQGYEGVLFIASLGTLTATQVTSLKAQHSKDDGSADAYVDATGAATGNAADADSNKLLVLDVRNPQRRYVRPVLKRATANAVVDGVVAILYSTKKAPTTQLAAQVAASKVVSSPA